MSLPAKPLGASTVNLPAGNWTTVFACLCARFPMIEPSIWAERFAQGKVLNTQLAPLSLTSPYQQGLKVYYFREVQAEPEVPFYAQTLYEDEHLIVLDKPHFLVVAPVGCYVEQSMLQRLQKATGNNELTPIHRLDRLTAGLVLVAKHAKARDAYQALFRQRRVEKRYEALAPALDKLTFPLVHSSCMTTGEPFFRMQQVDGEANSQTRIEVLEKRADCWRYALYPHTGKKHQLRVHMAALGAPIINDDFYPDIINAAADDYSKPLKLLATDLCFEDPFTGQQCHFSSRFSL